MKNIFLLIFLFLVGCTKYVQPTYLPLTYEKRTLDLSKYKNIDVKSNNKEICMAEESYQSILFLLVDLKNYIEYQNLTIKSLDNYQQKIYQNSSKK